MIKRAALIGLGTMGPGIAARLSRGGLDVTAYDVSPGAIERARGMLDLAGGVLDRLDIEAPGTGAGKVRFVETIAEAVDGAELVIENVPENIDINAQTYRDI
ncbi:3-hydroxyacyl-CoA dehydrogenase family protein, partial [Mesorhizobium sp. M7A.F.Ca.US.014.04.1.1]|uniref:3-hydroxyacyl-CoA dehydrogenase NAD-binding domain-containing protein n=1 Tax=Mesorhizobium sp. M7A.F.Ca.US.014.04.1.1 TaxID=2496744 RepID=UPI000FD314E6